MTVAHYCLTTVRLKTERSKQKVTAFVDNGGCKICGKMLTKTQKKFCSFECNGKAISILKKHEEIRKECPVCRTIFLTKKERQVCCCLSCRSVLAARKKKEGLINE